jgi:hypothetical protein
MVLSYAEEQTAASENDDTTNEPPQDFSRFRHDTQQHTRMPCLVCHVRSSNSPTPKMPGHIPCASCHSAEFAKGNASPICAICHTATDVKSFPPLRSFNAVFDHGGTHARRIVRRVINRRIEVSDFRSRPGLPDTLLVFSVINRRRSSATRTSARARPVISPGPYRGRLSRRKHSG